MSKFGLAVLTALFLFVATFIIGLIPITYMNRLGENETGFKYMKLTSDFGIGMLLGTSCMLVIPEGVDKFANASRS